MANISFKLETDKVDRLAETVEICLYRIKQEATHHAVKYSKFTSINIKMYENESFVKLVISDNG